MKKYLFSFLIIGSLFSHAFVANRVFAEDPIVVNPSGTYIPPVDCPEGQYCLLEALPDPGNSTAITQIDVSDLPGYIKLIFRILLGVIGVLAVVMIILGGVQYMSTDALSGKEGGRETITRSIMGLLIALGAYVILNTINPNLLNLNIGVTEQAITIPAAEIETNEGALNDAVTVTQTIGGSSQTYSTVCPQTPVVDGQKVVTGMAWPKGGEYDQLINGGVQVTSSSGQICTSVGQAGCTSTYELPQYVINNLISAKSYCGVGCEIIVTGGTECWLHKSHGPGLGRVDLSKKNSALNNYILTNYTKSKYYAGWGQSYVKGSSMVVDEGDHWHVHSW